MNYLMHWARLAFVAAVVATGASAATGPGATWVQHPSPAQIFDLATLVVHGEVTGIEYDESGYDNGVNADLVATVRPIEVFHGTRTEPFTVRYTVRKPTEERTSPPAPRPPDDQSKLLVVRGQRVPFLRVGDRAVFSLRSLDDGAVAAFAPAFVGGCMVFEEGTLSTEEARRTPFTHGKGAFEGRLMPWRCPEEAFDEPCERPEPSEAVGYDAVVGKANFDAFVVQLRAAKE